MTTSPDRIPLWREEIPSFLVSYLLDDGKEHPCILVIPGGAYKMCSDREAEPIAFAFMGKGYAAFILRYSLNENSAFPKPLDDATEAMRIIREHAQEWKIDPDRIAAIGFSAGGHLCAALSTMGEERPDAQILGYPCILEKIGAILATPIPGLDTEVDKKTPPAFIFASAEDNCVPIANSLTYAKALDEHKIPFEMHIFSQGWHGFSLADSTVYGNKEEVEYNEDCAAWFDLCISWLNKIFR
ncbi:MAG: alpha/beta hydrolase, partial [Clostridia bacterium]|nr:alpha/beta hydrolase [Clostridia bacterium]